MKKFLIILFIVAMSFSVVACDLQGDKGETGVMGLTGPSGADGYVVNDNGTIIATSSADELPPTNGGCVEASMLEETDEPVVICGADDPVPASIDTCPTGSTVTVINDVVTCLAPQ